MPANRLSVILKMTNKLDAGCDGQDCDKREECKRYLDRNKLHRRIPVYCNFCDVADKNMFVEEVRDE